MVAHRRRRAVVLFAEQAVNFGFRDKSAALQLNESKLTLTGHVIDRRAAHAQGGARGVDAPRAGPIKFEFVDSCHL